MINSCEEKKGLADIAKQVPKGRREIPESQAAYIDKVNICLLYTSDAADE